MKFYKQLRKERKLIKKHIQKDIFLNMFEHRNGFVQKKKIKTRMAITLLFLLSKSGYQKAIIGYKYKEISEISLMNIDNVTRVLNDFRKKDVLVLLKQEIIIRDISYLINLI